MLLKLPLFGGGVCCELLNFGTIEGFFCAEPWFENVCIVFCGALVCGCIVERCC